MRKKSLEDYKQAGKDKGIKYFLEVIPEHVKISILGWECEKGHQWKASFSNINHKTKSTGCPYCSKKVSKTIEDYKTLGNERGVTYVLDKIPKDVNTSTNGWKCRDCQHEWKASFHSIDSGNNGKGTKCPKCMERLPITLEQYKKVGEEKDIIYLLEKIPEKSDSKINGWQCIVCGYVFSACYSYMKQRGGCPKCSHHIPKTIEDYRRVATEHGIVYFLDEIPESVMNAVLGWRHIECGTEWKACYNNFRNGRGCPKCNSEGVSEELCRKIFENFYSKPFPRIRPDFLRYGVDRRTNLELDGYNDELKLAFEYQGEQHYKWNKFFHKTEEEFKERQKKDEWKRQKCKEYGIKLVEIPYTYSYENPEKLKKFILSQI